jgi:ribosomal protein S18 acetylase RimI-like enzyme
MLVDTSGSYAVCRVYNVTRAQRSDIVCSMGKPRAMPVVLVPLTLEERRAFTAALAADEVDFLVGRGDVADPVAALARARTEIEAAVEAAVRAGEQFWAAHTAEGPTVGWLWVKCPFQGLPPSVAFLEQILVKPEVRRHGYATAMLAALEEVLAASGWSELRLNVYDTNEAGRCLYERAGYEEVGRIEAKRQLRKRLPTVNPVQSHAD